MLTFLFSFGLAYVGTALLTAGAGHLAAFDRFRSVVEDHALFPSALVPVACAVVVVFELVIGLGAVLGLLDAAASLRWVVPAAGATAGAGFTVYLMRLLARPGRRGSCGCSPLGGAVSPASLLPGAALVLVGAGALLGSVLGHGEPAPAIFEQWGAAALLPILWGSTLAGLITLLPASVPEEVR